MYSQFFIFPPALLLPVQTSDTLSTLFSGNILRKFNFGIISFAYANWWPMYPGYCRVTWRRARLSLHFLPGYYWQHWVCCLRSSYLPASRVNSRPMRKLASFQCFRPAGFPLRRELLALCREQLHGVSGDELFRVFIGHAGPDDDGEISAGFAAIFLRRFGVEQVDDGFFPARGFKRKVRPALTARNPKPMSASMG